MLLTFAMFPSIRRYKAKSKTESQQARSQLTDRQWLIVEDLFSVGAAHESRRAAESPATCVSRGHSVGAPQRGPLERLTTPFSLICNVLASTQRVG